MSLSFHFGATNTADGLWAYLRQDGDAGTTMVAELRECLQAAGSERVFSQRWVAVSGRRRAGSAGVGGWLWKW